MNEHHAPWFRAQKEDISMSLLQTRTFQLLVIAYGFSMVAVGGLHLLLGSAWYSRAIGLLVTGAVCLATLRADEIRLHDLGASLSHLIRGLAVAGTICLLFWLVAPMPLSLYGQDLIVSMLLTGCAEELLFRGLLLTGLARLLDRGPIPWRALLVSSLCAALFHLPVSLWVGGAPVDIANRTLLHLVASLVLFGPLYVMSRNLWLAVLIHGVSVSPFFPALKEGPMPLLLFTALSLLLGRVLLRSEQELPLLPKVPPVTYGRRRVEKVG
jgi:membrane protease YdiL (CAAX protease family)